MAKSAVALGIIPARAHSSRFPFKVIAPIQGKPMLQYVWEAASRAKNLSEVIVATDHPDIEKVAKSFGAKVVMTPELKSGSDRAAFIAKDSRADIVVNLQADEPLLSPSCIDTLVETLNAHPTADIATLALRSKDAETLQDPNCVKVVLDGVGNALYFSRTALKTNPNGEFLKHIGIYAFRKNALLKFSSMPLSSLEITERLEQLRALENGMRIQVAVVNHYDMLSVDTPEDLKKVEAYMAGRPKQ